jgi:wyosine [tRNA(Phe)-imidazoG37] synthetase (radical SAM superfamily)
MIERVKECSTIPVAVITNGALLHRPDVRADLQRADVVMPTLTAGSALLYQRINRPHPSLTFERMVEGLATFRSEYKGQLWVEVMLIHGLNDREDALCALAEKLRQIRPDQVHLTLPDRPPTESWVKAPDQEGVLRATAILGEIAQVVHPAQGEFDLSGHETLADAVLAIIARHPMSERQIMDALRRAAPDEVQTTLTELQVGGDVQVVERYGVRFWAAAGQRFSAN